MPNPATPPFRTEIARHIWDLKYRHRENDRVIDESITDTWQRVAKAIASVEPREQDRWAGVFFRQLEDFRFLPGGRILAGAGTGRRVTLFNCFVMGLIPDSMEGIFDALKEGALTMQQGGGVGYDFSTLRPSGTAAASVGGIASGPVSFMRIWDSMCATLLSTGARRGAMMATLRCDHPDIELFVEAKRNPAELRNFNLSVQITDDFIAAVDGDRDWALVFPVDGPGDEAAIRRRWPGRTEPVDCRVLRRVRARTLWQRIMRAAYDCAEPGILFVDRINRSNNLRYCERISATNPCGEIPLPPYGACDLGSINLTRFVSSPFSESARVDLAGIENAVRVATRMLDNVIDLSGFPLPQQAEQAKQTRRIGLGVTGLADMLLLVGLGYAEPQGRALAATVLSAISRTAYRESIALAREKGAFPKFQAEAYLSSPFVQSLPEDIRNGIEKYGIRNSHLIAIAPAGTISLLADNVSAGLEPVLDFEYRRRVRRSDGSYTEYPLLDYALWLWRQTHGGAPPPPVFNAVATLAPQDHLAMQAALQPHVDNAISKTINVPADIEFSDFQSLYLEAYRLGLKGCTAFRPNPVTGAILMPRSDRGNGVHCCGLDRESD